MAETVSTVASEPGIEPTEEGALWPIPRDAVGGIESLAEWGLRVMARGDLDRGLRQVARLIRQRAKAIRDRLVELERLVAQPDPKEPI